MILINGEESAVISAADRGAAYGDGVFRTLRARNRLPRQWARHYAKLASDCAALGLGCPEHDMLEGEVGRVCAAEEDCVVKVVVTRGVGGRGYGYSPGIQSTRIVMTAPLPDYPVGHCESGVRIRRCRLRLAQQPALAGLKHLNRLENVLARAEWSDVAIAEGVMSDTEGNVIGGTMTNLFTARAGALFTPALDRCGVAGVTRERVMHAASRHDIACHTTRLSWDDLLDADEIILVNSIADAWPVREFEGRAYNVGPVARAIQEWLRQDD